MELKKAMSRGLIRRALKPIPIIGAGAVLAFAAGTIRRKGFFKGGADVMLDLIPIVGLTKAIVEAFTGDLIPDKSNKLYRAAR
jgi:hypothetical protein